MSIQLQAQALNTAQALIYSRSNLRRAFADFDDTEIAGTYLRDNSCIVVRRDGSEQAYDRSVIKTAFLTHTTRLKDFFSYLGPNYRGPSVWRQGAYIMFKGWDYTHALGHLSTPAKLQRHWADKFIHLTDIEKVKALLQSDQTDLGHLVAPDGLWSPNRPIDMESAMEPEESSQAVEHDPYCSCGSFQRQLLNLSDFQSEIEGYRPWCIHLTWIHRYRDFLCERTKARELSPSGTPEKCVAWAYSPPRNSIEDGRFILLHTKYGMHAPISHWRTYKPNEVFTQHDAWNLFTSMMEAGYVPFPLIALPQLKASLKNESQSTSSS